MRTGIRKGLRLALVALSALAAAAVIVALVIQFGIRLSNDWQQYEHLPQAAIPGKGSSVLVISPHPDDETLGCGGLIATAVRNGARVHVAFVTNGDGYKLAVGTAYKRLKVTPAMCVRFAYHRQNEAIAALSTLGLRTNAIVFLGYPDRGLAALWTEFWEPSRLYTSRTTGANHSPYTNAYSKRTPYCGESLIRDIQRVLREQRPTDIYIPHPYDNHPDHYATYCFATAALAQLHSEGWRFASKIRVHTYLVHRGDWPTPKGEHPDQPLVPPCALARGDTRWASLPLSTDVAQAKRLAIRRYRSQVRLEPGFMRSFARSTEIFGDLPTRQVRRVSNGTISVDSQASEWARIPPAVIDPVGDYVVAGINKGGDVRSIYLAADSQYLYIRLDCAGRLSRTVTYRFNFRGLGTDSRNDRYSVSIRPPYSCSSPHTLWSYRNNILELALPRRDFRFDQDIFIQVETRTMRLLVDNTGWQRVVFSRKPARAVAHVTRA